LNGFARGIRRLNSAAFFLVALIALLGSSARAQTPEADIIKVPLPAGRSYPIHTAVPVTRVSVANPAVADVVVIGERDVVVNARTAGETDVIMWMGDTRRYRDSHVRAGTGIFNNDAPIDPVTGKVTIPTTANFFTVLTDFGSDKLLAFIQAEQSRGNARILARPNLMTANRQEGNFLAGGEIPVPIAQPGQGGATFVTITYREFGIRLHFIPEILSDSLITLSVRPEVSTLDYANAVIIAGFRVPALRTRRVETTVDVRPNESLIISGLMEEDRSRVRNGIPLLMDIPILGALFSSTSWQSSQTELLVVVRPVILDPSRPRAHDLLRTAPDTTLPAREVLDDAVPPVLPPQPTPRAP
jgi:Flp pilus assembly secretin CpaC